MKQGVKIDYTKFEKHTYVLRSKGYEELIYPFESIRKDDLIELTIYNKEAPIFKKGKVDSYDEYVINCGSEEFLKVDIVRLFKKSPVRKNLKRHVHVGDMDRQVVRLFDSS